MPEKRKLKSFWVGLIAVLLASAALGSCDKRARPPKQMPMHGGGKPVIVVSLAPIASLVDGLVHSWAQVHTLLPAGVSPHGFELTPQQIATLSEADILVVVGMGLDTWAEQAIKATGRDDIRVLRFEDLVDVDRPHGTGAGTILKGASDDKQSPDTDADDDADAKHDDKGETKSAHTAAHAPDHASVELAGNPHVWLDPVLTMKFVAELRKKFEGYFQNYRQPLRARGQMLLHDISKIHNQYLYRTSAMPQKRLVTFHSAFDRLADRYGLVVVDHLADVHLAPGGEVPPANLVSAIQAIRQHRLQVVYVEPQFSEQAARTISRETGVTILRLDPLGVVADSGVEIQGTQLSLWKDLMAANLAVIVKGQRLSFEGQTGGR